MLLMVEKGIRGGLCHAIHWYEKANNKYTGMKMVVFSIRGNIASDGCNKHGWGCVGTL